MQPAPAAPRVVVRGEAVAEVLPDAADLTVTVEVHDRRRDAALTRLTERQRSLADLLEAARGDLAGVTTDTVAVYPETGDGSRVSGHVAVTTTRVRMADVAAAGELAVAVATLPDTSLHGPHWRVSRGHPVRQRVRGEAVADAVARARAYAAALACRLTGLVEVRDVDTSGGGPARAFAVTGPPRLDLQPAPQEVHGQVEATFTMSVPDQEVFTR